MNYQFIIPQYIPKVIKQIYAHAKYKDINAMIRVSFETRLFYKRDDEYTDEWIKSLWKHLYLNEKEPMPLYI